MNDFEIRSLADCYNGSLIREFDFAEPISESLILYLGRDKKLDYFPDLPKPYFRIEAKGKYIIRGVQGNDSLRVVLKQPHPEMNLFSLKAALDDFFSPEAMVGSAAGLRCTVANPPRAESLQKKAVRKRIPNGFDRKHFSAQWRIKYLTHRGSGS